MSHYHGLRNAQERRREALDVWHETSDLQPLAALLAVWAPTSRLAARLGPCAACGPDALGKLSARDRPRLELKGAPPVLGLHTLELRHVDGRRLFLGRQGRRSASSAVENRYVGASDSATQRRLVVARDHDGIVAGVQHYRSFLRVPCCGAYEHVIVALEVVHRPAGARRQPRRLSSGGSSCSRCIASLALMNRLS